MFQLLDVHDHTVATQRRRPARLQRMRTLQKAPQGM